jgi:hypothetical protein
MRWILLGWLFPLSHSWILSDAAFETVWAPLHFAWIVGCSLLLAVGWKSFSLGRLGLLCSSYGVTLLGAWLFRVQTEGGWVAARPGEWLFLAAQYAVLGALLGWRCARESQNEGEQREEGVEAIC